MKNVKTGMTNGASYFSRNEAAPSVDRSIKRVYTYITLEDEKKKKIKQVQFIAPAGRLFVFMSRSAAIFHRTFNRMNFRMAFDYDDLNFIALIGLNFSLDLQAANC